MIDHPRLAYTDDGVAAMAASLDPTTDHNFATPSRETFTLSTQAIGLVVDDLEYSEREEISSMTARTLLLTGGAYVPEEKTDPVDLVQRLRCPDGGKHPTERETERVAAYLETAEIEQRAHWLAEELIEETQLGSVMTPEEIGTQRERMNDLRGIAKDL